MKIAFRKSNPDGFFKNLFGRYTKWSLKTDYAHGGVVIGDTLYHSTAHGFTVQKFVKSEDWDLFCTDVPDSIAMLRLNEYQSIHYDFLSLLSFKLPFRISDAKRLYCFELVWIALTGENPIKPISPDTIMAQLLRAINEKGCAACNNFDDNDGYNGSGRHPDG